MINNLKELRKNLDTFEGRVDFVTYMSSFVLVGLHILYMCFYVYEGIYLMMLLDLLGIIIFNHYLHNGIKNHNYYSIVCFAVITVHTISAILNIGWNSGFYLWFIAIDCAFYLPSYSEESNVPIRRTFFFGLIFVVLYFILEFLLTSNLIKPLYPISNFAETILFVVNSGVVFAVISSFTYFFTKRQKYRVLKLKQEADYDTLTNIKNRNAINREIDERVNKNDEFSLAILDIDLFKNVNDTYGHNAGDLVLRELALKLKDLEGYGITPARWGGEEFIILGPSDMSQKEFIDIMQDFRRKIRESKFKYERSIIKITISIGISYKNKKNTIKKTIETADKYLYIAKDTGRNRVVYK
jgi:diguanylate cyclase (GGDEF)-like protein